MDGKPVTIRLLDPPLHEFLAAYRSRHEKDGQGNGVPLAKIKERVAALHEFNPMLGHRGCRLSITFPVLCEMQTQAIIEAAVKVAKKGIKVIPEIMIPLIGTKAELGLPGENRSPSRRRNHQKGKIESEIPGRHDDRDSARRFDRRQDR